MFWGDLEGAGWFSPPPTHSSNIQKLRPIRVKTKVTLLLQHHYQLSTLVNVDNNIGYIIPSTKSLKLNLNKKWPTIGIEGRRQLALIRIVRPIMWQQKIWGTLLELIELAFSLICDWSYHEASALAIPSTRVESESIDNFNLKPCHFCSRYSNTWNR